MDIREIADRLEIMELRARYARAVDTRDWALWRDLFTEDAHDRREENNWFVNRPARAGRAS